MNSGAHSQRPPGPGEGDEGLEELRSRLDELQGSIERLGTEPWSRGGGRPEPPPQTAYEQRPHAPQHPAPAEPYPPAHESYGASLASEAYYPPGPDPHHPPYGTPPQAPDPYGSPEAPPGYRSYEPPPVPLPAAAPPPPPPPQEPAPPPEADPAGYAPAPAATNGHTETEPLTAAPVVVVVDAGPFADLVDLRRFEESVAQMEVVRDVHVRRYGHRRAQIEVGLAGPYPLGRELQRLGRPMRVEPGPEGQVVVELADSSTEDSGTEEAGSAGGATPSAEAREAGSES